MDDRKRKTGPQEADVVGTGQGAQSFLNSDGTAEARARRDAEKDVGRTIDAVRCPKCKQRNPGALWRYLMPYFGVVALCAGLGFLCGIAPMVLNLNMNENDRAIAMWLMPLSIGGFSLLIVPFIFWIRWGSIEGRVQWTTTSERQLVSSAIDPE
jgi:hypothetical protein